MNLLLRGFIFSAALFVSVITTPVYSADNFHELTDLQQLDIAQLDKKLQEEHTFRFMKELDEVFYERYLGMIKAFSYKLGLDLEKAKTFATGKIATSLPKILPITSAESLLEFEQHYINALSYSIDNEIYMNENIEKCYPYDPRSNTSSGLPLELEEDASEVTVKVNTLT